jgi:hypothetical protein
MNFQIIVRGARFQNAGKHASQGSSLLHFLKLRGENGYFSFHGKDFLNISLL